MKCSIKDFCSKCDQIRRKLQIWSHLQKKSLMEIFIFCAVKIMSFFLNYRKTLCQKLEQNKPRYSWEIIGSYKSLPKNLPLVRVTPRMRRLVKQKTFDHHLSFGNFIMGEISNKIFEGNLELQESWFSSKT